MKGFVEEKGRLSRLIYDEENRVFVLRPVPHPFPLSQVAETASTPEQKPGQPIPELDRRWSEAAE